MLRGYIIPTANYQGKRNEHCIFEMTIKIVKINLFELTRGFSQDTKERKKLVYLFLVREFPTFLLQSKAYSSSSVVSYCVPRSVELSESSSVHKNFMMKYARSTAYCRIS